MIKNELQRQNKNVYGAERRKVNREVEQLCTRNILQQRDRRLNRKKNRKPTEDDLWEVA